MLNFRIKVCSLHKVRTRFYKKYFRRIEALRYYLIINPELHYVTFIQWMTRMTQMCLRVVKFWRIRGIDKNIEVFYLGVKSLTTNYNNANCLLTVNIKFPTIFISPLQCGRVNAFTLCWEEKFLVVSIWPKCWRTCFIYIHYILLIIILSVSTTLFGDIPEKFPYFRTSVCICFSQLFSQINYNAMTAATHLQTYHL